MCKQLGENPGFSKDLSVRVICLSKQNDWDNAVLILSSAASLSLIDTNREILLINYLDPSFITYGVPIFNYNEFDEIDFYLGKRTKNFMPELIVDVKYRYASFLNDSEPTNRILAAEELTKQKAINVSKLFEIYRRNSINGSKGFWGRMIAIKNLDQTLKRNNEKAVSIAVQRAIKEMSQGDLLFTLSSEYYPKLENLTIKNGQSDLNDALALIFALKEIIPSNWINYQSKNKYLAMVFDILKSDVLNETKIDEAMQLIDPSFYQPKHSSQYHQNKVHIVNDNSKNKGLSILQALEKSSGGTNSSSYDLYNALLILINTNQKKLAKSILIEYLLYYSIVKV